MNDFSFFLIFLIAWLFLFGTLLDILNELKKIRKKISEGEMKNEGN